MKLIRLFSMLPLIFLSAIVCGQNLMPKMISLKTGVKLEYVESGNPHGVPIVLLHGLTDSWRSYEQVIPLLNSARVLAVTLRGHGNSDKPVDDYEVSTMAEDVSAFMDEAGVQSAVIVGFSMGGSVAQRFVLDYPAKTSGLILVGSFASFSDLPSILEFNKVINQLTDPIDPKFITDFQRSTIAGNVPDHFFKTVCRESAKVPAHVWKSVTAAFVKASYLNELKTIRKPVLIFWGDKDFLTPEVHQHQFEQQIPGARLIIYKNAGHALHWEQPVRFANDLKMFLNERVINYQQLSDLVVQGLSEAY